MKSPSIQGPGLIVDAVVGYSLTGALRDAALDLVAWADDSAAPVLSLDVPSGLDSTTGESEGRQVAATRTLTLALPKAGLAGAGVGGIYLGDIGIPHDVYRRAGVEVPAGLFGGAFTIRLHHAG